MSADGKAKHDAMMKDCVSKEQAKSSSTTMDAARKSCMDKMRRTPIR